MGKKERNPHHATHDRGGEEDGNTCVGSVGEREGGKKEKKYD